VPWPRVIGWKRRRPQAPQPGDPGWCWEGPLAPWHRRLAARSWQNPSQKLALIVSPATNGKTTTNPPDRAPWAAAGRARPRPCSAPWSTRWPGHRAHGQPHHSLRPTCLPGAKLAEGRCARGSAPGGHGGSSQRPRTRGGWRAAIRREPSVHNLSQDHLDYTRRCRPISRPKALLFAEPFAGGGCAVVNIDKIPAGRNWRTTGRQPRRAPLAQAPLQTAADAELADGGAGASVPMGSAAAALRRWAMPRSDSPLVGRFNLIDLLQAVGVLQQQGVAFAPAGWQAIPSFRGVARAHGSGCGC